jgi:hypothetical protein
MTGMAGKMSSSGFWLRLRKNVVEDAGMVCGSNYSILKLQSAASSVCGKWRKQQLYDPYLPPHAADEAAAAEDTAGTSCSHRLSLDAL